MQQPPSVNEQPHHCEVKGATSKTASPTDDQPGFVAEEPEYCCASYRLIQSGQTLHLTIGQAILCEECIRPADAIRVTDDLVVVVEDGRLR